MFDLLITLFKKLQKLLIVAIITIKKQPSGIFFKSDIITFTVTEKYEIPLQVLKCAPSIIQIVSCGHPVTSL